jgi:hypothetical protein
MRNNLTKQLQLTMTAVMFLVLLFLLYAFSIYTINTT